MINPVCRHDDMFEPVCTILNRFALYRTCLHNTHSNGRGVTQGIRIRIVCDAYSGICSGIWKGIHYGSVLVRYGERRVIPSDTL